VFYASKISTLGTAVNVRVRVDNTQLISRLRNGERRLRYAVVNSLNQTALEIQKEVRANVRRRFVVRRDEFIMRQSAIISFASVRQSPLPMVEVYVGQKPRLFLPEFEHGGTREPAVGKHVALPVIGGPARPTIASRVPPRLTFERFGFVETHSRGGRRVFVSPNQRFYLIAGVGVFMRMRNGSKLVYSFREPFALDPRLRFFKIATSVTKRVFNRIMERETVIAIGRGS